MRISFDLDDTLICGSTIPTEQYLAWWRRWRYPEQLRHGTRSLMTALVQRRCRIWIYTSSCRSPRSLKAWFRSFGIPIEGVVNQARHERAVGLRGPSKYPPAFGIDLHVDDSPGVAMEGADHRFAVLVVTPEDPAWVDRVLSEVDARIGSNSHWNTRRLPPSSDSNTRRFFRDRLHQVWLPDRRIPYYAVGGTKPGPARKHPVPART